jgi:hypothetical protein
MQDAKDLEAKVTERNIASHEYRESGMNFNPLPLCVATYWLKYAKIGQNRPNC